MRSAAALLSSHRRGVRRISRHLPRTRQRPRHRGGQRPGGERLRTMRAVARSRPSRRAKRRVRVVHAFPRGYLPAVRH
jgi:hypothetical protein